MVFKFKWQHVETPKALKVITANKRNKKQNLTKLRNRKKTIDGEEIVGFVYK